MRWATLLGHPRQERTRVDVTAVAVVAAKRPGGGQVAALGVAIAVAVGVGADDTRPALTVGQRQELAVLGQPDQHVIGANVGQADRAQAAGRLHGGGDDTERSAELLKGEVALGVELSQDRREVVAARL